MNISKKGLFGIVLIVALLTSAFAYALLQVFYEIPTVSVTVGGIGVEVKWWLDDTPTIGDYVTTIDFGILEKGAETHSLEIVFIADCYGYDMSIGWETTLNPAIGTIVLQVEEVVSIPTTYNWIDRAQDEIVMSGQEMVGFREVGAPLGTLGHAWIKITIEPDAIYGIQDFSITFIGTQVV